MLVIGPTDAGKSSFILAATEAAAAAGNPLRLIDLDPGQKMLGPPGSVSLGSTLPLRLDKFLFVGTTSASAFSAITKGATELARFGEPFIANTSGFVRGLGARLQSWTIAALDADLVIAIGDRTGLGPIVEGKDMAVLWL
ncbi:MAG TPA: Clp1/GlmU family protein, partial [Allosphingosinicella sp.]|nr:Clp1/GlmU family protein [Allosphingosinicella sp.]